jgi:hypothetical protein
MAAHLIPDYPLRQKAAIAPGVQNLQLYLSKVKTEPCSMGFLITNEAQPVSQWGTHTGIA